MSKTTEKLLAGQKEFRENLGILLQDIASYLQVDTGDPRLLLDRSQQVLRLLYNSYRAEK